MPDDGEIERCEVAEAQQRTFQSNTKVIFVDRRKAGT